MYFLCYNNDGGIAVIIYAAVAPDEYDDEYAYDSRQEAEQALDEM